MKVSLGILSVASSNLTQGAPDPTFAYPEKIYDLVETYCLDCHDETQKGDIRLDDLAKLDLPKRLDMLNRVQEQIYFRHMPPKKKDQPGEGEREALLDFLSRELAKHEASTLEGKLQKPEFGNYVDHEKLFSGEYKDTPGFTYDRRWLISEFIFEAKFQRMLRSRTTGYKGKQRFDVMGGRKLRDLSLTNPFLLPETSGVRYYANEDLTGGHISSMLTNAQKVSETITESIVPQHRKSRNPFLPSVIEILEMEESHKATLASRRKFLDEHIERVCAEIRATNTSHSFRSLYRWSSSLCPS